MQETIQLVGPIHKLPHHNWEEFFKAEKHYKAKGFNVITPHSIKAALSINHEMNGLPGPTEKEIMAYCIHSILHDADKVVMLPGVENSDGAPCELLICKTYHIPVIEAYTDKIIDIGVLMAITHASEAYKMTITVDTKKLRGVTQLLN